MPTSSRLAIYPGSFDPITLGHEDIARRALRVADRLVIGVARHQSQKKQGLFSLEERLEMVREVFAGVPEVEVTSFTGLLVDFAREQDAALLVRGLRSAGDLEYELRMAVMNRSLHPDLETIFLAPEAERAFLSASLVREVSSLGGDVSPYVSATVLERLLEKTTTTGG